MGTYLPCCYSAWAVGSVRQHQGLQNDTQLVSQNVLLATTCLPHPQHDSAFPFLLFSKPDTWHRPPQLIPFLLVCLHQVPVPSFSTNAQKGRECNWNANKVILLFCFDALEPSISNSTHSVKATRQLSCKALQWGSFYPSTLMSHCSTNHSPAGSYAYLHWPYNPWLTVMTDIRKCLSGPQFLNEPFSIPASVWSLCLVYTCRLH